MPHPPLVRNWLEAIRGAEASEGFEFLLYSDTDQAGSQATVGPYEVFSTTSWGGLNAAVAVVRYLEHWNENDAFHPRLLDKPDTSAYHAGWLEDEFAAAMSLALGRRFAAGPVIRRFVFWGPASDPKGHPVMWDYRPPPPLMPRPDRPLIPQAYEIADLRLLRVLDALPTLSELSAATFIKATRSYQRALLLCETDPNLAWLLFISAAEGPAALWGKENRIRGPRARFVEFISTHLPPPPQARPELTYQHAWHPNAARQSLSLIYRYRSNALHNNTPFPDPMLRGPFTHAADSAPEEVPDIIAQRSRGGTWVTGDCPCYLHVFEYWVRYALLNWLKSLSADDASTAPTTAS